MQVDLYEMGAESDQSAAIGALDVESQSARHLNDDQGAAQCTDESSPAGPRSQTNIQSPSSPRRRKLSTLLIYLAQLQPFLYFTLLLLVLFLIFFFVPQLKRINIHGDEVWGLCFTMLLDSLTGLIFLLLHLIELYIHREVEFKRCSKKNVIYLVNASKYATLYLCLSSMFAFCLNLNPNHKSTPIYGYSPWKWSIVVCLIAVACHVIRILVRLAILIIAGAEWFVGFWFGVGYVSKSLVYMAKGLSSSINMFLFFVVIYLVWVKHMKSHINLDHSSDAAKRFLGYAEKAFVALWVGAGLCIIKDFLLCLWKRSQVYKRTKERLLTAWWQLYFINILVRYLKVIFSTSNTGAGVDDHQSSQRGRGTGLQRIPNHDKIQVMESFSAMIRAAENEAPRLVHILAQQEKKFVTYDTLELISRYVMSVEELWTSQDEKSPESYMFSISSFRKEWRHAFFLIRELQHQQMTNVDSPGLCFLSAIWQQEQQQITNVRRQLQELAARFKEFEKEMFATMIVLMIIYTNDNNVQDAAWIKKGIRTSRYQTKPGSEYLYKLLEDIDPLRKEVRYQDMDRLAMRAYKECLTLGRALAGNKEVAEYLNNIFTFVIIVAVIIIWLIKVKLATLQLFAAVASPVIALTFIFGDTAKSLFQGLFFALGSRPFDVGDICIIKGEDNQKLEVKRIRIWTTVFVKDDQSAEEVIYPNSSLTGATVVKHNRFFDQGGSLEFYLSNTPGKYHKVKKVRRCIKSYLKKQEQKNKFDKKWSSVEVKEISDKIILRVDFKHMLSSEDMPNLEYLKLKNKRTTQLWDHIMSCVDKYEDGSDSHHDESINKLWDEADGNSSDEDGNSSDEEAVTQN